MKVLSAEEMANLDFLAIEKYGITLLQMMELAGFNLARAQIDDKTLILAEESRKAVAQISEIVRNIVLVPYGPEKSEKIVEELVSGKYTHDFPITAEGVCELLGQCVQNELPLEVYQLMDFYKMGKPSRAGVEFVALVPLRGSH